MSTPCDKEKGLEALEEGSLGKCIPAKRGHLWRQQRRLQREAATTATTRPPVAPTAETPTAEKQINQPITNMSTPCGKEKGLEALEEGNRRSSRNKYPKMSWSPKEDPNDVYIEEEAHLYHNPPVPSKHIAGVTAKDLRAIPPPPPVPTSILPDTKRCTWSWDEKTRVLLADFSVSKILDATDEKFLLLMMERDDVTVVSTGIVSSPGLNPEKWSVRYISNVLNDQYLHKIRRFDIVVDGDLRSCYECDTMLCMRAVDYNRYIVQRERVMENPTTNKHMEYVDSKGTTLFLNVETCLLYIIDLDIGRMLPDRYADFKTHMRLPEVLPGGSHCMMSAVCMRSGC
jgi:hypothetical protein